MFVQRSCILKLVQYSAQIYLAFRKVLAAVSPIIREVAALTSLLQCSDNKKCPSSDYVIHGSSISFKANNLWPYYILTDLSILLSTKHLIKHQISFFSRISLTCLLYLALRMLLSPFSFLYFGSMEDLTDPERLRTDPKSDRTVSLYGYLRGTHMKNQGQVHIPGAYAPLKSQDRIWRCL